MAALSYNPAANEFEGSGPLGGVPQVMWHITDRCPLRCPYCFATKTAAEVRPEEVDRIVSALVALSVQKVDIGGGEPLVAGCLASVVEALINAGIAVTLTTSGAGPPEARQWLVSNAHRLARVILSVDGGPADHDELRGRAGTYAGLSLLAEDLRANEYKRLRVNTVVTSRFADDAFAHRCLDAVLLLAPSEWCLIQPHPANKKPAYDNFAISEPFFHETVALLRSWVSDAKVRVLTRTAENYSGYWVLYPDGQLRPHTDGSVDGPAFALVNTEPGEILAAVRASSTWLPGWGRSGATIASRDDAS